MGGEEGVGAVYRERRPEERWAEWREAAALLGGGAIRFDVGMLREWPLAAGTRPGWGVRAPARSNVVNRPPFCADLRKKARQHCEGAARSNAAM